jgi:hypothetical protein
MKATPSARPSRLRPQSANLRHSLHDLDRARRFLQQLKPVFEWIDAFLACNLVDERFGGELVGCEADIPQLRRAHVSSSTGNPSL